MSLAFLNNITLASNEEVKPSFITSKTPRATADKNPEGSRIRLFKNGAIFPSKELVEQFALEYQAKDSESASFGFDIVSSKAFPNTAHLADSFIIIAVVPKSEPKVDVFGSTKFYSAEEVAETPEGGFQAGDPKSSVLTQGTTSFGKEILISLLQEVYGFEFKEDQKFVDLEIVDQKLTTNDGNYYIPKTITRGEKKGGLDVVVRKNIDMFPLVIADMLEGGDEPAQTESAEEAVAPIEEANVPEIDMTSVTSEDAAVEPSIDEILDEEEAPETESLVETEEESLAVNIDLDGEDIAAEEEANSDGEDGPEAGEGDEEFDGISI